MDEKQIQFLFDNYAKGKGFKDINEFRSLMGDEGSRKIFFDDSNKELGFKDYNDFEETIGVKKKPSSNNGATPLEAGSSVTPNLETEIPLKIAQDFTGIPDYVFNVKGLSKPEFLEKYKSNKPQYERNIATAKAQSALRDELYKLPNGRQLWADVVSSYNAAYVGDAAQQRENLRRIVSVANSYGGEKSDEIVKNLGIDFSNLYGKESLDVANIEKDPKSAVLNNIQLGAWHLLEDTKPNVLNKYKAALLDDKDIKDNLEAKLQKQEAGRQLELLGATLQKSYAQEKLNPILKEYNNLLDKDNLYGLSPEEQVRKVQLEHDGKPFADIIQQVFDNESTQTSRYPMSSYLDANNFAQELVGQKHTGLGWLAAETGKATENTAKGIWDIVSEPFRSDENSNLHQAEILGSSNLSQNSAYLKQENQLQKSFKPELSEELQKDIDAIKNDPSLSDSQKLSKASDLLMSRAGEWRRSPVENGETNIGLTSLMYGVGGLAANLAPFVLGDLVTGGVVNAGALKRFSSMFTSAAATSFHDAYVDALERGEENPFAHAARVTAINSAALAGADAPAAIRKMIGGETAIGKLVSKMTDDEIAAALKESPKALTAFGKSLDAIKKTGGQIANTSLQSFKSGAKIAGITTAGQAVNDAIDKELKSPIDYAKQAAIETLKFGVGGTMAGIAGRAISKPTEMNLAAISEAGKNPEPFLMSLETMEKNGSISPEQAQQVRTNIEKANKIFKSSPILNNPDITDKVKREYLYNTWAKKDIQESMAELPPKMAEKAEMEAMVLDHKNELLLHPPTDKQLESQQSSLEKKLEPKKDAEGKIIELPEKEKASLEAELEAVKQTIEARQKEVPETKTEEVKSSTTVSSEVEFKDEGLADEPTSANVTERTNQKHPFITKISDALRKLGILKGDDKVIGGQVQGVSKNDGGGFTTRLSNINSENKVGDNVGELRFNGDGSIRVITKDGTIHFDKNGNPISHDIVLGASDAKDLYNKLEGSKQSIIGLEKIRDSDDFKYKTVEETDGLGNRKKVKRLKTNSELSESTKKINDTINKAKEELKKTQTEYDALPEHLKAKSENKPIQNEPVKEEPVSTVSSEVKSSGVGGDVKELNSLGADIAFDKPQRKDYGDGEKGDLEYANANIEHNKKVDEIIGGLTQEGTLRDNQGGEYLVTITSQGVRVVNKMPDGTEGSDISYRKGKRITANTPFTNGFSFKPKEQSIPTQEVKMEQPTVSEKNKTIQNEPIKEGVESNEPITSKESIPTEASPVESGSGSGKEPPKESTGIVSEPKRTVFSHRGLQEVATEFGLDDIRSRDKVSDLQLFKSADETINKWAEEGSYKKNIDDLVVKAKEGEIFSPEQNVIMAQHIAQMREQAKRAREKFGINSPEYNEQLKQLQDITTIGQKVRSDIGAALRVPTFSRTYMPTLEDAMTAKMEANGTDALTEKQKAEVEKEFDKIKKSRDEAEKNWKDAEARFTEMQAQNELLKQQTASKGKSKSSSTSKTGNRDYKAERKSYKDELKSLVEEYKAAGQKMGITSDGGAESFIITTKMARAIMKIVGSHLEETGSKLADVTKKTFDDIKDLFDGITEADVHDVIAGKYTDKKTRSELSIQLNDIRTEAKLLDEYNRLLNKEPKSEKEKQAKNARLTELRKNIKELQKEQGEGRYSDKQKAERAIAANNKREQEIRDKIAKGDFEPKPKPKSFIESKEFKAQYPELYKKALDSYNQKQDAQHDFDVALLRDSQAKRYQIVPGKSKLGTILNVGKSVKNRLVDFAGAAANTTKKLVTGVDDSSLFMQTLAAMTARPVVAAKALKLHALDALSQKRFDRNLAELHNSPDWDLMQKSGLDVTEPKSLSQLNREEAFSGKTLDLSVKFKGEKHKVLETLLAPFERAFTSLGNGMRVIAFRSLAEKYMSEGKTFESDPQLYKDLALMLNTETGRGKQNEYIQKASELVTKGIWSPRLMASRLNMLGISDAASIFLHKAGTKGYYSQLHPEIRKEALKSLVAFSSTVLALSYLAAWKFGGTVDNDPRSQTFLDIKMPNGKSYNISGGFSQYIRAVAQSVSGGISKNGVYQPFNGQKEAGSNLLHFMRGKVTPVAGVGTDLLTGKDFAGQPVTLGGEAAKLTLPLSLQGVVNDVKKDGLSALYNATLPSFVGITVKDERDYTSHKFSHEATKLLQDNQIPIKMPSKKYIKDGEEVDMTEEEYKKYLTRVDERIDHDLKQLKENGVVEGGNIPDAIKEIVSDANRTAKEELFGFQIKEQKMPSFIRGGRPMPFEKKND